MQIDFGCFSFLSFRSLGIGVSDEGKYRAVQMPLPFGSYFNALLGYGFMDML